jgi:hypothetical protein
MADDLAAMLKAMRDRAGLEAASTAAPIGTRSCDDVVILAVTLETVLAFHRPITRRQGWRPTCRFDNHRWPCPEVEAVIRDLAGLGGSGG